MTYSYVISCLRFGYFSAWKKTPLFGSVMICIKDKTTTIPTTGHNKPLYLMYAQKWTHVPWNDSNKLERIPFRPSNRRNSIRKRWRRFIYFFSVKTIAAAREFFRHFQIRAWPFKTYISKRFTQIFFTWNANSSVKRSFITVCARARNRAIFTEYSRSLAV